MLSGVYRFPAMESVVFGKPFVEALAPEVDRLEALAVFILASGTLARETDTVDRPARARQPARRQLREDRRAYAAHRCRRRGERGA